MVFVLDRKGRPLMPCSEKRARLLLERGRAVVHRRTPFTIRVKDRLVEHSTLQPVVLKLDPGSRTTGVAVVREEQTPAGVVHHALHLAEITHRGETVREHLLKRAAYRRRRRTANLRYRPARFNNRLRPAGWLPPSLRSRVVNLLTWAQRYARWAPIAHVDLELVRFDTQQLENPEISGVEYQQGTLAGWEVWEYLLAKFERRCAYCGREGLPLEREHIIPTSRGGTDRVSNLAVACHDCNQRKGNQTASEFGHPEVQAQAQRPLKDAAAVNSTRWVVLNGLQSLGLAVFGWSGGRTKWNRSRFGVPKSHALDAACAGDLAGVDGITQPTLAVRATGRGRHCRTLLDAYGFPRAYLMRQRRVHGFQTGDLVRADVSHGKCAGMHVGRVSVRARGSFRVGQHDGVSWRTCVLLQRAGGYAHHQESIRSSKEERLSLSPEGDSPCR
jgi:5-methylcytosine-specific restriction endonuclease McrA